MKSTLRRGRLVPILVAAMTVGTGFISLLTSPPSVSAADSGAVPPPLCSTLATVCIQQPMVTFTSGPVVKIDMPTMQLDTTSADGLNHYAGEVMFTITDPGTAPQGSVMRPPLWNGLALLPLDQTLPQVAITLTQKSNCQGHYTCSYVTDKSGTMKSGWYTAGAIPSRWLVQESYEGATNGWTRSQSAVYIPAVTEHGAPRVKASAAGSGLTTKAVAIAFDPYGKAMTLSWDFGDGSSSVSGTFGAIVTHTYTAPGEYEIAAHVRTADGRIGGTTVTSGVVAPKPLLLAAASVPVPNGGTDAVIAGLLQGWPDGATATANMWTTGCPVDPYSNSALNSALPTNYVAVAPDGAIDIAVGYSPPVGVNAVVVYVSEYVNFGGRSVYIQRASDCLTTFGVAEKTTSDTTIGAILVPVATTPVPIGHVALIDASPSAERRLVTNDSPLTVAPLAIAHLTNAPIVDLGLPVGAYAVPPPPTDPAPPTPFPTMLLTVQRTGTAGATGTVTSAAGITCGSTCSKNLTVGRVVTLSATAGPGSRFAGWSGGACAGLSTCTLTMSAARTVTATFTLLPAPTMVSAGGAHSCARLADGTVKCWGANSSGQLGNGSSVAAKEPVLATGITGASSVAAGTNFTCAVVNAGAAGRVRCWGSNTNGQLGNRTTTSRDTASTVVAAATTTTPLAGARQVAVGAGFACAVLSPGTSGTVKCWGSNGSGRLGDGTTTQRTAPVTVKVSATKNLTGVTAVAAGGATACAVMVSGATRCWGANTDGQLGTGTLTASHFAVAVSSLDGVHAKATAITVGGAHTCARLTDGSLRCWGRNSSGQLGDGTLTRRLVPAKVRASAASFLTGVSFVTAGEAHTCAFLGTGSAVRVRCWGANASGQLGMNTTTPSRYAVAVSGVLTNGALSLSCGGLHTVALVRGTARPPALGAAWGSNSSGQLGNGTTAPARLPTVIARL